MSKGARPTTKRHIEPKATVDYFTPADSDVDDSTAEVFGDESSLKASVSLYFSRVGKRDKKPGGFHKNQMRKAHEAARKGQPPGKQVGSHYPNKGGPRIDKAVCSCGAVHRRSSPGHEAHIKHFPQLCRKRAVF